jgi:ribonuclease D
LDCDLSPDVAHELAKDAEDYGLSVDLETTGLSPEQDTIQVVSLATPARIVVITVHDQMEPRYLIDLLGNTRIIKVFHHALFDLSFIETQWKLLPSPVFCTKVAARIAGVTRNPTLQGLAAELLGVRLDKLQQKSNWAARPLSEEQVKYAALDVRYLGDLRRELTWRLSDTGRSELFDACMRFIGTRVQLGLMHLNDVFAYEV